MSVHREKDQTVRHTRKTRESSSSRKPKREESSDRRPIITQDKPVKQLSTTSKDKSKIQSEKVSSDKTHRRRTDGGSEAKKNSEIDRKSLKSDEGMVARVKKQEPMVVKSKKEMKPDAVRDILERKIMKKMEAVERKHGREEKPKKVSREDETAKKRQDERKLKSRRDRTRTRTLSPTEVKQLVPARMAHQLASGDYDKRMDRREDKVGSGRSEIMVEEGGGGDDTYEDDFEDYESDFEEDDVESEQNEELPPPKVLSTFDVEEEEQPRRQRKSPEVDERWKLTVQRKEIENIRRSIKRENEEVSERRKSITQPGGEDSDKENIDNGKRKGGQIIDFSKASRRQKKQKEVAATRKRGEELLSMISLDAISYSIFEIPPIPYDEYMKSFGKSNTKQVHVQTNEDDLDEETQTDEVSMCNKWTQNPPEYLGSRRAGSKTSYILTKEERLGVGGDVPVEEDEMAMQPRTSGLWSFLSRASQVVLMILERRSGNFLSLQNMPNHSKAMAFGDGFVLLNVSEIPFLKGRSIASLCLLSKNSGKLLSVHVNKEKSFQKSMICVWSFRELSKPLRILIASNRVTSSCFDLSQGNLVFAGLSDGTICVWDLREPSIFHNRTTSSPEWTLQSATYTTSCHFEEEGHSSAVVAVRMLGKVEGSFGFGDFTPMQICSLDKNGTVVIWSVIQIEKVQRTAPSEDLGLAYWGRVKLVKSSSFHVFSSLRDEIPGLYITCNDFVINEMEDDGLYVANSFGSINHCSSFGSFMKPKFYAPGKQDAIIETTCLELCPFNGNYFLAGCGDGTVRLHSRHQEYPLICLNFNSAGDEKEAAVVSLTWMQMRPCVFFALDSMSRIHIWNLGVSDMYPEASLMLTEKRITCMKLLPTSDPRQTPFIVIGTEGGSIEIHRLKKEYGARSASEVRNEMKMFLKYVSIL